MPKLSIYRKKKNLQEEKIAIELYKQGHTLRSVATIMERSYEWVRQALLKEKTTQKDP